MTGSSLMAYSPNASLGVFSPPFGSDDDQNSSASFNKEQGHCSEYHSFSESLTSQRSRNYSSELNKEAVTSAKPWGLMQALHSTPSDSASGNQSDLQTIMKSAELKAVSTRFGAVAAAGDGESMQRKSSWKVTQMLDATAGPLSSGQNRGKFTWPDCAGGSMNFSGSKDSSSFDFSYDSTFWKSVEGNESSATDGERKRVSFEYGNGCAGDQLAEGKVYGFKSILKVHGTSHPDQMKEAGESHHVPSHCELQAENIVNSTSLNKKWLSARRSSANVQPQDVLDVFSNVGSTPVCLQSKSISGVRRKSEPLYLPTLAAKKMAIEDVNIERNTTAVDGLGQASKEGTPSRVLDRSTSSQSATYLLHLKNTERISKHIEHIVKKFHLDLLDEDHADRLRWEEPDTCLKNVNMSTNNNVVVQPHGAASEAASAGPVQPSNQPEEISLEQKVSQTRSFSLRRPFARFQKKTGSLDKSKSVAGSNLDKDSGTKRPLSTAFHTKESESSVVESSEQKVASTIDGKLKKPKRKFSLNLFRKSRDGFTEATSIDRGQAGFKGQANKDREPSKQVDDLGASGISDSDFVGNAKRATSEASKVLSHQQQQQQHPKLSSPENPEDQIEFSPGKETKFVVSPRFDKKKKTKTESNKELSNSAGVMTEGGASAKSSSHVIVPLEAKASVVFHDAVFYFPSEKHRSDDDDESGGVAVTRSEGKVPKPSKSSSLRLPAKGAISDAKDQHMVERKPSILKRMRAFFGRSSNVSSTSYNVEQALSGTLLDQAAQDKEGRGIEEWKWSVSRGGHAGISLLKESSSPTDFEKLCLPSKNYEGPEVKTAEGQQQASMFEGPTGDEEKVKYT